MSNPWVRLTAITLIFLGTLVGIERHHTYSEPLHGDLTTFALFGHEILSGRLLYRDLVDHSPPLRYWTYALAEKVFGYSSRTLWILSLIGALALLVGFFYAGWAMTGTWYGGLLAALLYAIVSSDLKLNANQAWIELFANIVLVWAVALIAKTEAGQQARWPYVLSGFLLSLATLYWQPLIVAVFLIILALSYRLPWRRLLLMSASVLFGWILVAILFALKKSFWSFIDLVFLFNQTYSHYNGTVFSNVLRAFTGTGWPSDLRSGTLLFFLPLSTMALGGLFWAWRRGLRSNVLLLLAYAIGALAAVALPGTFYPHYFQLILPPLILSSAHMGLAVLSPAQASRSASLTFSAFAILALVFYEAPFFRLTPQEWSVAKYGNEFMVTEKIGLDIPQILKEDETFYDWGTQTGLYFWSRRRPPTGAFYNFFLLTGPLATSLTEKALNDLHQNPPELFIALAPPYIWQANYQNHPIYQWGRANYRPFKWPGHMGSFVYYARRGGALEKRILQKENKLTFYRATLDPS